LPEQARQRALAALARTRINQLIAGHAGHPNRFVGGNDGAIKFHSSSVRSLAQRRPDRSYWRRVISVHMVCSLLCFDTHERIAIS
jgi:hypothetical protein